MEDKKEPAKVINFEEKREEENKKRRNKLIERLLRAAKELEW